jgi:choline kinase
MKAIILAAGEGKRLQPLTKEKPKCLLKHKDETILERLINQIKRQGIEKIIVIVGYLKEKVIEKIGDIDGVKIDINHRYREDTNIYSMLLAVKDIDEDIMVFEADIIAEDEFIKYVSGTDFENKSVWFTGGKFTPDQNGGILKTDGKGNIIDIKIVEKYDEKYKEYDKLTGVMRIASKELEKFKELLKQYSSITLKQYYLVPWMDHIEDLASVKGDVSNYLFRTFNTIEDYKKINNMIFDEEVEERDVYLVETEKLCPIEAYDEKRLPVVRESIIQNGCWRYPLRIEKNHYLILDGHHSFEIALKMKLRFVPVIGFDYNEVKMWSLREEIPLDKKTVINNAKNGKIYPYKTVKHKFPNVRHECKIRLEELT